MNGNSRFLSTVFLLGFAYNFMLALNFSNNAIMPLYITSLGGGAREIGLFMGIFSLSAVLGRPVIGVFIDRFGIKPSLLLGSALMAITPIGYYFLQTNGLTIGVWTLRIIQGFGFGAHFSAFFTFAARSAPRGRRNEFVAKFGLSGLIAHMIGPPLGEKLVENFGLGRFFIVISSFALAAFILAFLLPCRNDAEEPDESGSDPSSKSWDRKGMALVLFLAVVLAISFSTTPAFLAPLAEERHIIGFGFFFSGFSVAGATVRLLGSHLGDRVGLRRILFPSFILYGSSLLLVSISHSVFMLIMAGILCGVAHGIGFPAVTTLGYNLAPASQVGRAVALTTGMMDGGSAITSLALGVVAGMTGFASVFHVAATAPFIAAVILLFSILRNPEPIKPHHKAGEAMSP